MSGRRAAWVRREGSRLRSSHGVGVRRHPLGAPLCLLLATGVLGLESSGWLERPP